jgi:iron complex outermembrane receptor protein
MVVGPFDYYASLSHISQDGYRTHTQQNNQRFFSNFGYQINPHLETRFYVGYVNTDSELAGSLTKTQMEENPRQAQTNPFFKAVDTVDSNWKRDFELFRVANKTTYTWDNQKLDASVFWSNKDLDHPILIVIDQYSNDFGSDFRYTNENDLLGNQNIFVAGFRPVGGVVEDNRFTNALGSRGAKIYDRSQVAVNLDLYTENQHYLTSQLVLVTGLQLSYALRDNTDRFPIRVQDDQDYYGINPKIGMRYEFTPENQIFANFSRSFEPPSFGELTRFGFGGPAGSGLATLDAQTASTVEMGTRGQKDRFAWEAAYYHSWVDDELLSYQIAPGVTQTLNGTATHHEGIELGFSVDLIDGMLAVGTESQKADRLYLRQVYNWNHFYFDSDPVFGSQQLAGIPEHHYQAELIYEHPCGFYIGTHVEWIITKTPVDHANTLFADPYALLGFKTGYRTKKGLAVFFEAKNLTDKEYAATTGVIPNATAPGAGLGLFNPGDGLSFYGGVEFRF